MINDVECTDLRLIPEEETQMPTMRQGLITLLPKPGKDKRCIDNLRPITLLNRDVHTLWLRLPGQLPVCPPRVKVPLRGK